MFLLYMKSGFCKGRFCFSCSPVKVAYLKNVWYDFCVPIVYVFRELLEGFLHFSLPIISKILNLVTS